jgi:phosphoglycolate phosphatase
MKFDALILDFDGTIADTRASIVSTVKKTLLRMDLPPVDENEVKKRIGLSLKTTFQEVSSLEESQLDTAIHLYRSMYNDIALQTVTLFPGVFDTLQTLYDRGIKLVIASSKGKQSLAELLEHLGISSIMSCIAGEQDVRNKKPAPDLTYLILDTIRVSANKALVIGDTKYDIQMGKSAGCSTCGVIYGNGTKEEIEAASPSYVIDTFESLIEIVLK